jgi:hypothetical protein
MSEHFDPDEAVPVLTCDGCGRESGDYDDERKGWLEVEPWEANEGKQRLGPKRLFLPRVRHQGAARARRVCASALTPALH